MSTPRRYAAFVLLLSSSWFLTAGCDASTIPGSDNAPGSGGSNAVAGAGGKNGGPTVVNPGGTGGGIGIGPLNPLCGVDASTAGPCTPDNELACQSYQPPDEPGAGGGSGQPGTGGEGGVGASASGGEPAADGGEPAGAGAPQGGASPGGEGGARPNGGVAGEGVAGEGGQAGAGPGSGPLPAYSCQVTRQNNQPYRECVPAGLGTATAPCFSAADCAPGLACVTEGEVGRCLPYCCRSITTCDGGSYCANRPLRKAVSDASEAESPLVPVCVPADGCSLEDPYPCPTEGACRCKSGTACMVVRNDGTTTCLPPGRGEQGDICPCAWNHVCSKLTNQCVKICRTDAATDECGEQKCQASSELPESFGLCVGPTK